MAGTDTSQRRARVDPTKPVVEFIGVRKNLSGRQILDGLDFAVRRGETFVIIGYSGTGKSVSLRHMVGLMQPDQGSIRIEGDEITTMTHRELEVLRRRFGVLFQSGALIGWLTLFQNVELPLIEHTKMSKRRRAEVVQEKLELVNLWQDRDKFPAEISGGMKKRAGLARAIALEPQIVLYDEPTSGLDPVIAHEIDKLINGLRDNMGMTQIVVTHDMESAYTIANRIGMFYHGKMLQIGTPAEIRTSAVPEVQHFITGGREGAVSTRSDTAIQHGRAPGMMSTRTSDKIAAEGEKADPPAESPVYVLLDEVPPESSVTAQALAPAPQQKAEQGLPTLLSDRDVTRKIPQDSPQDLQPEPEAKP